MKTEGSLMNVKKRKITGKRSLFYHVINEDFYTSVKRKIGCLFPFHKSQDKKAEKKIGKMVALVLFEVYFLFLNLIEL